MSGQLLLQYVSWALFLWVFATSLAGAIRHPRRSTIDAAVFFGIVAAIVIVSVLPAILQWTPDEVFTDWVATLLMALPYALLRLVQDFGNVPAWLTRIAEAGLALSAAAIFITRDPRPAWLDALLLIYFIALVIYATVNFIRAAAHAGGVAQRRLAAAAAGSGFIALDLIFAGVALATPDLAGIWTVLTQICGLGAGVSYYLAFAPPAWVRRAWQEPELRAFLARAAELPRLPDTTAMVLALEDGAQRSLGAELAAIGLWDHGLQRLVYQPRHLANVDTQRSVVTAAGLVGFRAEDLLVGQAFLTQQPIFSDNPNRDRPENSGLLRRTETRMLLAAPITAGDNRLGVLSASASTSIFAEEDARLLRLLADQAAVILESRSLIDAAAQVQAREEATRLKDDFLSAAAHDLKTPLTSLVARAQLMQRQIQRDGQVSPESVAVVAEQSERLRVMVNELLDAARVEDRRLAGQREPADLREVLAETCKPARSNPRDVILRCEGPLHGEFDVVRIRQLFANLVENALKYSPGGEPVEVEASEREGKALVTVIDRGIGIPAEEVPHIFERFHRGANVNDRQFPGMGLGLYICKGIVEEHNGRIWATSSPGLGTTIHVSLPLDGFVREPLTGEV